MASARRFVPVTQWKDERQLLGMAGERVAIAYLTSCGWSVEAHRFRRSRHDLDLVVRHGNTVAFVEVKTRRSDVCGSGAEAVTRRKQRDLARVAQAWILRNGQAGDQYRFDLISIQNATGTAPVVEHISDAWRLD
jgi:putative endonuclease